MTESIEIFNTILNNLENALDNMIIEHNKSEEVFKKQIIFMKKQHEYSINRIDRFLNIYKSKYPQIKKS